MIYSNRQFADIGRRVVADYPALVSVMVCEKPQPPKDLSRLLEYLVKYCDLISVEVRSIKGPVYKSCLTEKRKVFISAMVTHYNGQHGLNKQLSQLLNQDSSQLTKIIKEVDFRYKKDQDFIQKVNALL